MWWPSENGPPGTVYPDSSFDVPGVPVVPGTNTLTATYTGPAFTNVPMTATDTSTVVLGDTAFTHDANGNLTSDATFTYQYDLANQLTNGIRKADNTVVLQCRYDALGRRVEAIRADGTVDRYVYFPGTFLVLAVLDETNAPKEFYTRGPDLSGSLSGAGGIGGILACTYSSGPVLYHHADLMGNVIATTDASSSIVSTFRYSPFGQLAEHLGSCFPRYRFSSKETDLETDLLYFGYRYLCPRPGQWMTRDPLSETEGENLYGYVGNNPFSVYDAQGLARVHFDEAGCKWQVKLHWKVEFLNAPYQEWSDSNKIFWKTETAKVVSNYFSTRNYRCFPCSEACSLCQTGVTVDFQLIYVESDAEADYLVTVVRNSMSDSKTTYENRTVQFNDLAFALGETANGYKQVAAIHETGHMLGLKHPGVAYGAKSNFHEDYAADAPSLMGFGMEMRVEDFDKAFCSHIKTDGEGCNPWHAK